MAESPNLSTRRMPQFKAPPVHYLSEKNEADLYPFTHLGFNVSNVRQKFHSIKGPLTSFAPYSHEHPSTTGEDDEEEGHGDGETQRDSIDLDRPITPINEEIKKPPKFFSNLVKLVRRRISANPKVEHLQVEDQQGLAAIIMGELNGIWSELKVQAPDPFLSPEDNKELHRRITVHVVAACEQLFHYYVTKATTLKKRGVFSGPANMSRLKAQLTLDTNKFLNVLTIRRYILEDMKKPRPELSDSALSLERAQLPPGPSRTLTHEMLINMSRPKSQQKKYGRPAQSEEVLEILSRMPKLDKTKLLEIIADLPKRRQSSRVSTDGNTLDDESPSPVDLHQVSSAELTKEKLILRRSSSMPMVALHMLLEDLGVEDISIKSTRSFHIGTPVVSTSASECDAEVKGGSTIMTYVADDLKWLDSRSKSHDDFPDEDDLPPLIQALTRNAKHDGQQEVLKKKLLELDERERAEHLSEIMMVEAPCHPQPAVVSAKMPNNMTVRASDTRVSERVCLSTIVLEKNEVIYNDLIGEIDHLTVKRLDKNLFLGDEITEVYTEIMKTVPTDHLSFHNDPLVVQPVDELKVMPPFASATLTGRWKDRIINSALHEDIGPPWGAMNRVEWAKGSSPPKGMSLLSGALEDIDELTTKRTKVSSVPTSAGEDVEVSEFMARSYAAWFQWWKNTTTNDDYIKYISTAQTDYMGVLFHCYDSDAEDEELEEDPICNLSVLELAAIQELEKKINETRNLKKTYQKGMWNINSVVLGGLGKDPIIEESELTPFPELPKENTPEVPKMVSNKTKVVMRLDARAQSPQTKSETLMQSDISKKKWVPNLALRGNQMGHANGDQFYEDLQLHMEQLWNTLKMPDKLRLDMAIKYSSDAHYFNLDKVIKLWEKTADCITNREAIIARLEIFERFASDPNRFFEKGNRGSSYTRLEEARIRNNFYKEIKRADTKVYSLMRTVKEKYSDEMTYQGRPYADKMKWDRTEMLYWLQEERKQQALLLEQQIHHLPDLPLSMVQLEPLSTT